MSRTPEIDNFYRTISKQFNAQNQSRFQLFHIPHYQPMVLVPMFKESVFLIIHPNFAHSHFQSKVKSYESSTQILAAAKISGTIKVSFQMTYL